MMVVEENTPPRLSLQQLIPLFDLSIFALGCERPADAEFCMFRDDKSSRGKVVIE